MFMRGCCSARQPLFTYKIIWEEYMKKLLGAFAAVFLMLALCSCGSVRVTLDEDERPEAADGSESWSVLIYMCGGGEKSYDTINSLCEREYPANVTFAIGTGGGSDWKTNGIDGDFLQRFVAQKGSLFLKDQVQLASMGSHETLADFLKWGIDAFPAKHYMLILSGGGSGTEMLGDKTFNGDVLTVEELSYAVSLSGQSFDIIGLDVPYGACFENASSLSPYAKYMVASEEQCAGWDYGRLADCLIQYPYVMPNELGQIICNDYMAKCEDNGISELAAMSVTDLSQISVLAQAFDGMADVMADSVDSLDSYGALARNVLTAQTCVGSGDMVDIASLAAAIAPNVGEPAQGVADAIGQAVIYNTKGSLRPESNGLSVYYPQTIDEEKLNTYMKSMVSDNYKHFIKSIAPNVNVVDAYVSSDYNESWAWCDYVGRDFGCTAYMDELSRYSMTIDGDMSIVKDVRLTRYCFNADTNSYHSLGTDKELDCDWAGQKYAYNTSMTAPFLNGQPIQADFAGEVRDMGRLYTTPLIVNDETAMLISFRAYETNRLKPLGIWQNGSMLNIGRSDVITPVHNIMSDDEMLMTGKSFRPVTGIRISDKKLPDGSYILEYELEDIYSKIRRPTTAALDKKGGEAVLTLQ